MIGNDIVDLSIARQESNWRREGFLSKIYTIDEVNAITTTLDPETMVWIFWTMKESAYKIWHRDYRRRCYNPKYFECKLHEVTATSCTGTVSFGDSKCDSLTTIDSDFILSICSTKDMALTALHVKQTGSKRNVDERNGILRDNTGIPYFESPELAGELVSITHHGRFCSYLSTVKLR
ncbi:MAG: hypothetical protein CFE23_15920 [Flavobacterium sp. BFFFF1]|uniref:4'-phosphopantetheinyl transferase family protein n=1 Tax=Flavobacterium sp. BFFFF1 TaxID=2015557 RepID=UPI000BD3F2AA|nr:4'-phosphopantetheinyl transferase superfamily protein [Flavobacterium sp. BFFFF1]OYU79032.1 MAG: hypothetical protein CFE23_15920 [Flavobacterium sp. BFFFF1]